MELIKRQGWGKLGSSRSPEPDCPNLKYLGYDLGFGRPPI